MLKVCLKDIRELDDIADYAMESVSDRRCNVKERDL